MNDSLPDDKTLVNKACGGDERAFADLINQHRSLVFGVIWTVLRDADDTEDATQETFILAYRNLNQLDDVGKFSSWLYTIARNVALKWVRKRTLEARGLSRVQEYQQLDFLHPEKVVESQYASDLKRAFKLLSPADRRAQSYWWNERGYPLAKIDPRRWVGRLATRKGTYRSVFESHLDAHGRWYRR
ncbi:MAG: RNA polymerase sigma factor [Gemmatimonadota bacterium]|nr:RNA polymerase sigma factor [Gemmatimonadota bacterium]